MPIPLLAAPYQRTGTRVTLDSLALGPNEVDELGVRWRVRALEGWDSPDLREDLEPRPLEHGAYRGTSYYGPRSLVLRGTCESSYGRATMRAARDRLAHVSDLTDTDGALTVHEDPAKRCLVRRSGRLRLDQSGQHLLRWELDLTAADPRKYAAAPRALTLAGGQAGAATNAGTFKSGTPLRLTFTGAGTLLVADRMVTVSGPCQIDTADGTVLDGPYTAYSRLLSSGALPLLPALTTTPVAYSGSGQVALTWRDAWV